jgi:hypothetical protein
MAKNHYGILEVAPAAGTDAIRAAYRSQMALYHPDKVAALGTDLRRLAEARARQINDAYAVLRDPAARAAYDRHLAAENATVPSSSSQPSSAASGDGTASDPSGNAQRAGEKREPASRGRGRPPRPRIRMPFAAVRGSGRLALFALVCLAGFPVIMPYVSAPDGWSGTFIGAAIVVFAFIVSRGLFFLGLWALLGLDFRAPGGLIATAVSWLFRLAVGVLAASVCLVSLAALPHMTAPVDPTVTQRAPFREVLIMSSLGGLALSGAGLCLASLMPWRIGRRFM